MSKAPVLLLLLAACGDSDTVELTGTSPTDPTSPTTVPTPTVPTPTTPSTTDACVPSREAYESNALPAFERQCTECHGDPTQFGAPWSVLDYDELIAGAYPDRKVDAILDRLMDGSMPPATQGLVDHTDLDTMVGWASCGLEHPDVDDGLQASRPVWEAPVDPPVGTTAVNLSANGHFVDVNDIDDYQYFTFSNLVDEDVFIRRMEAVIDESRVVHHITLHHLLGYDYLYAWAPGTGAIEFPEGGIRLGRRESLVMEIHYNNGAGIPDVHDSSGIRLWVGPIAGTEWAMMAPAVYNINVPPGQVATATNTCRPGMSFEILAGMPHMHQIGTELSHTLHHADGTEESLIELTGWSFEAQYFYEQPAQVRVGDSLTLTCTYDNPGSSTVTFGEGTSDEMCFNFLYVTPPAAAFQCLL